MCAERSKNDECGSQDDWKASWWNCNHEGEFSSMVNNKRNFSKIPEKKRIGDGKLVHLGFVLLVLFTFK